MFDPADFLAVARALVSERTFASPPEASVRTAYGRIYYALYLLVRQELERRHHVHPRKLQHGAMYTRLQSSRASDEVRHLGRELERLYVLRQKADYELDPLRAWKARLEDEHAVRKLTLLAADWATRLHRLDFSSVATFF